jgi:hypothetical protein
MSTIKSSTTTTTAYQVVADTTGTLVLQTGATPTTAVTVGTDQSVTFAQAANLPNTFGFKNRIINGAMSFWQRATTYSGTPSAVTYTSADRWAFYSASPITASRSTDVAAGFQYSIKLQRPNAATTTNNLYTLQVIESTNMLDLQSQAVTISFWAKAGANFSASSSILNFAVNTGTVADQGSATAIGGWTGNAYPIITTATLTTTWTKYTATGTIASNALEMGVLFWFGPTGTAGADDSVYITGVQLEKGSTATSFDYRPYGTELQLCQRYLPAYNGTGTIATGHAYSTTVALIFPQFQVPPRTPPTGITVATPTGFNVWDGAGGVVTLTALAAYGQFSYTGATLTATVASGLTVGRGTALNGNNAACQILFTGCEL